MNKEEIKNITDYIFLKSNAEPADLALVFGTRHQEAINKVYELYKNNYIKKILVSGGINKINNKNEAEEMSLKLIDLGVKKEDIILEKESSNSLENVLFSKKIIDQNFDLKKTKRIILVVKHYHSRRALMTIKKYFPKTITFLIATYDIHNFTRNNWHETGLGREKVLSEWKKISRYLKKRDIEEL